MERLAKKFRKAREMVPKPFIDHMSEAEIGIIAFGSTDSAIQEARDLLLAEGIPTDYLRLRALPINDQVVDFIYDHERVYLIEMNHDGQTHQIISIDVPDCAGNFRSITKNDGLPLTAIWVRDSILAHEEV
jgi:2-oxoglutarate ferredoxin oxidoreductase subunit alpha